ncbi:hypothetical protein [Nocardioides sp.]|uniref:hypothetical protein n=1 Tax=Nocardioides sp. TaxID=35761 RepID=UPI001A18E04C|nr:hypothetical protein [Nocardioides sp.]MBJ7357002.1 hypothetical protein [Nocardioides sp.]
MTRHRYISKTALAVAILALVAALGGGGSYAAKLLTGKDIRNGSIAGKDVKKSTLEGKHVKDRSLTGADLKDGSLLAADLAPGTLEDRMTAVRVSATPGATEDAARAAAPETVLFRKGPFTVYGKCYTDSADPSTYASIYIRTSEDGAVLDSDSGEFHGGDVDDYLSTSTPEDRRELMYASQGLNSAQYYASNGADFGAFSASGTAISGLLSVGVKNGVLPGGNGPYGAGDACLFSGSIRSS